MEFIDPKDLAEAAALSKAMAKRREAELAKNPYQAGLPEDVRDIIKLLDNPLELQKEMAAKVKLLLDQQIEDEKMEYGGKITDATRKLIGEYNNMLESIQKSTFGEKSMHFHQHEITHAEISQMMRKHKPGGSPVIIDAEVIPDAQ